MQLVCIIGEAAKLKIREGNIVFKYPDPERRDAYVILMPYQLSQTGMGYWVPVASAANLYVP
ncbi:hypothetical protein NTGM5_580006 [Candidatus Nitrotoga sp. M5]|nr:hypothetical protein NTGM5_580006 [Candidatus Nitrotoga sp. M5]